MQLFDYCRESVAYDLASTGFDRSRGTQLPMSRPNAHWLCCNCIVPDNKNMVQIRHIYGFNTQSQQVSWLLKRRSCLRRWPCYWDAHGRIEKRLDSVVCQAADSQIQSLQLVHHG